MARIIVKIKDQTALIFKPAVIAWWEKVIVTPEHNNIKVFNRGISKGLKLTIPFGGHMLPISIVGVILAAKKAQKKAKKKHYLWNNK